MAHLYFVISNHYCLDHEIDADGGTLAGREDALKEGKCLPYLNNKAIELLPVEAQELDAAEGRL